MRHADGYGDFGMTLGNLDFDTYAKAYGIEGSTVKGPDDLPAAFEAAFAAGGVHVATVPVDYSENMRVLVDELRAQVDA